ncbi:MAG TPA: periplasmic heavy metal sensor [Steroidobacteraceae bacterium]|nr:periplasmic heavy metal sensor [Steroidobacteraceae bacterium]
MTSYTRVALLMVALTLLAGAAGGWLGVRYGLAQTRAAGGLDALLHRQLHLSDEQRRRLAGIEASYANERVAPEQQMRAANRELAAAVISEHRYGPAAQRAIGQFHQAMQALQEQTIQHILAMRSVLTPAQAQQFDDSVAEALDADQP